MTLKHCTTVVCTVAAMTACADTDWMVLPRWSSTGRTLMHNCRNSGTPVPLLLRWEKPVEGGKYRFLSVGNRKSFRFAGVNERGLAVRFTGAGPIGDICPPKSPENFNGHRGTLRLLSSCATAKEGVEMLRGAFERKLIDGALLFFLVDRNHAYVVECAPGNFAAWELTNPFCVYANYWKLPGMDGSSLSSAERVIPCCHREWSAREVLRRAYEKSGTISRADSFATSRTNTHDINTDKKFADTIGKRRAVDAPHNGHSFDSYLFEIDPEFGELSCVYVAYGPARHTVYLPVALGAADALPPELFAPEWIGGAYARRDAAKAEDPVNPAIVEFEAKLLADFDKARESARESLYKDDPAGARKILRDCLKKQAGEVVEFFKTLK